MGVAATTSPPPAIAANAVTALGTITPGSGFTNINTVTLAPTGGTGSGLTAVPTALKAVSATVVNGGTSGFANADTVTLANGVVLTVSSVSSGVVTGVTVSTVRDASPSHVVASTNPVAKTATSVASWRAGDAHLQQPALRPRLRAQIVNSGNYTWTRPVHDC